MASTIPCPRRSTHMLGFSNGYGSGSNRPISVWCGYCKETVEAPEGWLEAYTHEQELRAPGRKAFFERLGL